MKAFHNNIEIKEKYVARVKAHQAADEIIKGKYWENGRGCAVGCTLHSSDHAAYEIELGIPRILAQLEDKIFEALPKKKAKQFPLEFLEAINVGADLSLVDSKFIHWLLVDETDGVIKFAKNDKTKKAIQDIACLYERKINGENLDINLWSAARKNAVAAARGYVATYTKADKDARGYVATYTPATADNICTVVPTYATAAAIEGTAAAADAAIADTAYAAAIHAAAAAYAAADAHAYAAASVAADACAAGENARIKQADKLIELLKDAK